MFPAGEVAALDMRTRAVTEPQWNELVGRLARDVEERPDQLDSGREKALLAHSGERSRTGPPGQAQEKGLGLIAPGVCRGYHPRTRFRRDPRG